MYATSEDALFIGGFQVSRRLHQVALLLFLVAHLAGNLLVLLGPNAFNEHSHRLIRNRSA